MEEKRQKYSIQWGFIGMLFSDEKSYLTILFTTNVLLTLKLHISRQFSLSCTVVCLAGCCWFAVWTPYRLLVDLKRGPSFNSWPLCVHCLLVKVHLLPFPAGSGERNGGINKLSKDQSV